MFEEMQYIAISPTGIDGAKRERSDLRKVDEEWTSPTTQ
jgi:hypothetical protein